MSTDDFSLFDELHSEQVATYYEHQELDLASKASIAVVTLAAGFTLVCSLAPEFAKGLGWPGSAILSSPPASGMQSRLADPGAVHSNNNHWMIVAQGVTPTISNSCC